MSLFVFSSGVPSIEPTPTLGPVTSTTTDVADIGRFALRQGLNTTSASMVLDEIYAGTDWTTLLPVELSSFSSSIIKRDVKLNWVTASETNNSGFEIERSNVRGQMSNEWTRVGSVSGNGTTTSSSSYTFTDKGLATGNYNYRLKQIDFNGNYEYFNLNNEVNIGIPVIYDLSQNYPNPFNPVTKINFDLPSDAMTVLRIFDASGREVSTPVNEVRTAGYHSVIFNASGMSSGVYFYTLSAGDFVSTKKMLILK
ncbi:MAG: T9SS type A sorting domain-containing protein [Ignavibacteria bacterium]|nr:T9SS type A sorting domain-containing protein [Ignavibacteria bacterium]